MAKFTARLSDGSAYSVEAKDRAAAEVLVRSEDAARKATRGSPGGLTDVEQDMARSGINLPPTAREPIARVPMGTRVGPPPLAEMNPITGGRMNPAQLEALRTMPPPPPPPGAPPGGGIPTPQPPNTAPPVSPGMLQQGLEGLGAELTPSPGQMRTGIEGTGGILGAAAGTPLGLPGMVAGGALLAGAGAFLSEAVDPSLSPGEMYSRAGQAASFEALAPGVGEGMAAGAKMAKRTLAGMDAQLTTLAQHYGIRLGIEDLSTRGFLQRMRGLFGPFALLAKPFQEASKRKGNDILTAVEGQLNGVAPTAVDPFMVSRRTISESRAAWDHYRETTNAAYETWRKNATAQGAEFSPNITRQRAQEVLDDAGSKAAEFQKVNPLTGETMVTKGRLQPDPLARLSERITNLGDNQSVAVYDALKKDLQSIQGKLKNPNDRGRVGALIEGLELDLRSTLSSANSARELAQADRAYKKGKALFESATANRIGQFRKGIFEVGKVPEATTQDIGDAVRSVFETGNRRAVSEYRNLVGEQTFRQATRLHLQDQIGDAFRVMDTGDQAGRIFLDKAKLSKNLGLFDPGSERRAALVKMLDGTGVNVGDLENIVRLAEVAMRAGPVSVSKFASRRAVFGGLEAGAQAALPGMGGSDGLTAKGIKVITALVEGRRFGRWLTDPRAVKQLQTALNPGLQQSARTAAFLRLGRMFETDPAMKGYGTTAGTVTGLPLGAAVGQGTSMSPLAGPLGALRGALQTGVGGALSNATAAPFRGQ